MNRLCDLDVRVERKSLRKDETRRVEQDPLQDEKDRRKKFDSD